QCAQEHVPADAGKTIEIGNAGDSVVGRRSLVVGHESRWSFVVRRWPKSVGRRRRRIKQTAVNSILTTFPDSGFCNRCLNNEPWRTTNDPPPTTGFFVC